jgi:TonB family protein
MVLGLLPVLVALSAGDTVTCVPDTTGLTRPHTVFLGLAPGGLGSKATPSDDDAIIAAAIRSHFQVPPRVTLPMWAWFVLPDDSTLTIMFSDRLGAGLDAELRFELSRDGRLSSPKIEIETSSPELNAGLLAAVRGADSAEAFPFLPAGPGPNRRDVVFHLMDYQLRDGPAVPLGRVVVPSIPLKEPVTMKSAGIPRYPPDAQRLGIKGAVDLVYVVTPDGRVDPRSVRVVKAADRQFVSAAISSVLRSRFNPARMGGCAVPMLVQQTVSFNIGT